MKRSMAIFTGLSMLMLISVFSIAFSQGQSELANQHKIIHRLRRDNDEDKNKDAHPAEAGKAKPQRGNGINYHGGPLILGGTHVYYIWYGDWSGNSATTILTDLAGNIGPSPYFNINTTYYDGSNNSVLNVVRFSGSTTVAYPYGTSL